MYSGEMLTGDHFSVPFSRWSSFTCKSRVRVGLVDRNVSYIIRARCLRRFASTQQVDRWRTYMYLDKHSSHLICLSGRHGLYRSRGFTETAKCEFLRQRQLFTSTFTEQPVFYHVAARLLIALQCRRYE